MLTGEGRSKMLDMMYGPMMGMPRYMMEQAQSDEVAMVVLHALVEKDPKDVEGNIKLALEYAEAMSQRRREIHARQSAERNLEQAEQDMREWESRIKRLSADIEKSEAKRIEASRLLDAIDPDLPGKPKTEEGKRIFEERCQLADRIARLGRDMEEAKSRLSEAAKSRDQLRQKLGLPVSDPEKVESPDNPAVSC